MKCEVNLGKDFSQGYAKHLASAAATDLMKEKVSHYAKRLPIFFIIIVSSFIYYLAS